MKGFSSYIKDLLKAEKSPVKWLFPAETAMMLYALFTLVLVLFTTTNLHNAEAMVWFRVRIVMLTVAMWIVYRIWSCRLIVLARIVVLLLALSWWYPDTYELNRQFPNLDPVFAQMDQSLFGCQPALLWCQQFSSPVVAELMDFGYAMYYPMFVFLIIYIFLKKYEDFDRIAFVILASFYIYYVIYDLLPVTGPQYYYLAAGIDNIAAGCFPDVGSYFATHTEALPTPGYENGIFHAMVESAHAAGERPTAAFPSSHVGVSTITMVMALRLREWKYALIIAIPYLLLCFSTVYIQAHYAVDAIAGFVTAVPLALVLDFAYDKFCGKSLGKSRK